MNPYNSIIFDILFLFSVSVVWTMILYQLILTIFGYRYRHQIEKSRWNLSRFEKDLPAISILIPARNEEIVIRNTLEKLQSLDYERDKIEVLVTDDGSTDHTASIVREIASKDPRIRLIQLPVVDQGRGKAHALNMALKEARHDYIAVYDADNNPEPSSLKMLSVELISDTKLGAVIGKFRTLNKNKNILTRFINIETLGFQWILQAGRFRAFKVAILPGTNLIIRKDVLTACGGWDEAAITEDTELSVRIYQKGWKIKFVPLAVTWEQEPEKWRTWVNQRTRWVRGNNYVVKKFLGQALKLKNKFLFLEFLYLFLLYYLFLGAIVVSHLIFLFSGIGIIYLTVPGPYTAVWISAFILYILEIILVLSYENEDGLLNILITALMYFTYCQMWIYVVFRSFYLDITKKREGIWDKTEREPQLEIAD
ncbi:glycosyltransferase family 2 protein [bacterium]|nr:glycosyltransferase family 2 protein [bacterium]RQV99340.1 MAG: glycosyltransferase family 2 protein [bacterium]